MQPRARAVGIVIGGDFLNAHELEQPEDVLGIMGDARE
jgi:hypothetical protein